jgi:hypothetical protein
LQKIESEDLSDGSSFIPLGLRDKVCWTSSRRRDEMKPFELREYSLITWVLERLFRFLQLLSIATWFMGTRVGAQTQFVQGQDPVVITKRRGKQIEAYVVTWFALEVLLITFVANLQESFQCLVGFVAAYRILDILQATLNLNVFDRLRVSTRQIFVASLARTAILSVWNFFESIFCFSIIYSANHQLLKHGYGKIDAFDPIYFSTVTQLTIGYGDVMPMSWLRGVAVLQGACGFLLGVFAVSRVISFLPRTPSVLGDE